MKDNDMSTDGIPESVTANFSKELSNCAGKYVLLIRK